MLCAFAILQQRLNIVVVQPGFISHGNGLDSERLAHGPVLKIHECRTQQIVERVPERRKIQRPENASGTREIISQFSETWNIVPEIYSRQ